MNDCTHAGFVSTSLRVKAIQAIADSGIRVINWSWKIGPNPDLEAAFSYARKRGVVIVAPSGNGDHPYLDYPAKSPYVIAVGGVDYLFQRWRGPLTLCSTTLLDRASNYGLGLDFVARADSLWTTDRTGFDGYAPGSNVYRSGTSFASPQVAGAIARILQVNPNLSPRTIEILLERTAIDLDPPGWDPEFGHGLIDEEEAKAQAPSIIHLEDFEGPEWRD